MRFLRSLCVFAVLATCGHAADSVVYYGPSGNVLPAGQYQRVEVGWKDGKPVMTVSVVMTIGGDVPTPPPPVPDMTAKITALIAAVTADPTKAETSKGLAEAYKQILANAGTIKDAATLRRFTEMLIDALLADPKVAKAATWKPFTDGMKALTAPMDLAGVLNAYTIAMGLLGGGPVPPPIPPTPTAASAMILYESQQMTPAQNLLLLKIRDNPELSSKLQILDQHAKGQAGATVPRVAAAVQAAAGRQLPLLVLFSAGGSVASVVDLPATVEAIAAKLREAGI